MTETAGNSPYVPGPRTEPWDFLVRCGGCGMVRNATWLGKPHNCWRNEDGTYEEGGTFQ